MIGGKESENPVVGSGSKGLEPGKGVMRCEQQELTRGEFEPGFQPQTGQPGSNDDVVKTLEAHTCHIQRSAHTTYRDSLAQSSPQNTMVPTSASQDPVRSLALTLDSVAPALASSDLVRTSEQTAVLDREESCIGGVTCNQAVTGEVKQWTAVHKGDGELIKGSSIEVDDQRAGQTSDWKVWETRTQSWQSRLDANEPRVVFSQARVPGPSVSISGKHVVDPVEPWRASPAAALTWRDSPPLLGEESHHAAPCRDRGDQPAGACQRKEPTTSAGDSHQPSKPQEERLTTAGPGDWSGDHRQRDNCRPQGALNGSSLSADTRSFSGSGGLWEVLRQDIRRSHGHGLSILPVGARHSKGRGIMCPSPEVGTLAAGTQEQRCSNDPSSKDQQQAEEGWHSPGEQDGDQNQRGDRLSRGEQQQRRDAAIDPTVDECSEELGNRAGVSAPGEQGVKKASPSLRGRDYFEQRMGGSQPGLIVPDMVASMAQEWTDEPATEPKVLGVSEAKALAWRAERILPECMETLVQHGRPVLYEIACGPNSVLTEKVRAATGREDSAQRFAFWNGYDVSTSMGVRAIMSKIDKNRPEHVWLSLECGPFSKMQNVNQRNERQVEELKQKRAACIRMYVGGLLIYMHCIQHGITVTWEWAETCDAWRLPMVQNVFAKYQPWMCVVKGCRVQLKDHAHGGLLGKGWKLATTHAGVAKAMDLPCKCTQKHVPCQGKLTRQSAYYTEDFARRVTRTLLHQFDVRSLFHEVRGEQAPPKFLVGCSRECNCNMVNHPQSGLQCNVCDMGLEKGGPLSLVGEGDEMEVSEQLSEREKTVSPKDRSVAQKHGPRSRGTSCQGLRS